MDTETGIEETGLGQRGFSRRTIIKAGAIVGGTIWVAPMIDSFTNPAAAGSAHFCCGCTGLRPNQTIPPGGPQRAAFVGEADGVPPSVQDCVYFCAGIDSAANGGLGGRAAADLQPYSYKDYVSCGPSATGLTWSAQRGHEGCYSSLFPTAVIDAHCTHGVITQATVAGVPVYTNAAIISYTQVAGNGSI